MAFDEALANDVRAMIGDHPTLTERKMFGGIAFMISGNMALTVSGKDLMVRVGLGAHDDAVARPGARPSTMGERPMKGWVRVDATALANDEAFERWVAQGVAFANSLPRK